MTPASRERTGAGNGTRLVLAIVAGLAPAVSFCAAADRQGGGAWPGLARHDCGADIHVVSPNGHEQVYYPPKSLFEHRAAREIQGGPHPRRGISIKSLLKSMHARSVEVAGCEQDGPQVVGVSQTPGSAYIVLTPSGILKLMREVSPGEFAASVHRVRQLTFSSTDRGASPPAPDKAPGAGSEPKRG